MFPAQIASWRMSTTKASFTRLLCFCSMMPIKNAHVLGSQVCQEMSVNSKILAAGETSHAEETGGTGETGLLPQLHSDA